MSHSHIIHNTPHPDYPPGINPGIGACLGKGQGRPPPPGCQPRQVEVVSSPGRWPRSTAAIHSGPAPAGAPSSADQGET